MPVAPEREVRRGISFAPDPVAPFVPNPATDSERSERALWINFLGHPPEVPPEAPTEAEVRAWLEHNLAEDEELVALDCSMYPCFARVFGAGPALRDRVAGAWPHATTGLGTVFGGEGEDFVSIGQGTIRFLAAPVASERERRFVAFGSAAHSHRAHDDVTARFQAWTEADDGRP